MTDKSNHRKLRYKTPGEERRGLRKQRLIELSEILRTYDPDLDLKQFENAFKWSNDRFTDPKHPTQNDIFADPLLILRKLVAYKADTETLLAALLYPAARPVEGYGRDPGGLDHVGLADIQEKFGPRIHKLVVRTLELRSLERLIPKKGAMQPKEEQINYYKLMCIWMAKDPRAILIRGVQNLVNLEDIDKNDNGRRAKDAVLEEAELIVAPIVYIARYGGLSRAILDIVYRLRNPIGFALVSRSAWKAPMREEIGEEPQRRSGKPTSHSASKAQAHQAEEEEPEKREVKVTDEDFEELKQKVSEILAKKCGLSEDRFHIETRRKSAASLQAKAIDKNKTIEQLGDKFGFRVILHAPDSKGDLAVNKLDPEAHEELLYTLGVECRKVYAELSQAFGRGSRSPILRKEFADLITLDPERDDNKQPTGSGKDDRFDDYIRKPKASGYSSMQDTFFINVGGKLVEFEGQIVDEIRHYNNTYGPRTGHVYYKTKLKSDSPSAVKETPSDSTTAQLPAVEAAGIAADWYSESILDWYAAANIEIAGSTDLEELADVRRHVLIYDDLNQITGHIEPYTAEDFVHEYFAPVADVITAVKIDNDNPFAGRDRETDYALSGKLKNGDRVSPRARGSQPEFTYEI